jgi:hypothetical protein
VTSSIQRAESHGREGDAGDESGHWKKQETHPAGSTPPAPKRQAP